MAKKKFKFSDLSDDIVVDNQNETKSNDLNNFNLDIKELNNKNNTKNELKLSNEINDSNNFIQNNKINNETNQEIEFLNSKYNNELEKTKPIELNNHFSKYDIEVDYDSDVPIKNQIIEKQKELIYKKDEKQFKTFNEMLNEKNIEKESSTFSKNIIKEFIPTKEKLDVKTNIYLKPNLVLEITTLCKQTGQSRSAIINKLIEYALNDMKNK